MLRCLVSVFVVMLLGGCATGPVIKDFTNRSVGYGWLNIKEVDANQLHDVSIYQFRPQIPAPYYVTTVKEFKNGFLYYSMVLPIGSHKTLSAHGQSCLFFMCTNTIYKYSFGKQGDDVGTVVIKTPGVYYLGAYKLKEVKTGFFEPGKFEVVTDANAPSQREMLEEILKDAGRIPVLAERIKREMAQLR